MLDENISIMNELQEIINNHKDCMKDYYLVLKNYAYKKMSVGIDIYGMYFPDHILEKYFIYKGKLTNSEKKKNYSYYFDSNQRLLLTERYASKDFLSDVILYYYYYYYESKTEIVWYNMKRENIINVAELLYQNSILAKYIESCSGVERRNIIDSFREYTFNTDDEYIIKKAYIPYSTDSVIIMNSKIKKKSN